MTHPPEDRAPFCTQRANPDNRIEGAPGLCDDMYFCDACFAKGNEILSKVLDYIERGDGMSEEEVLELFRAEAKNKSRNKKN
jgi:hypothetical protein